jgi:integrase
MATALTAVTVRQAKAAGSRREIPDGGCPGLYLVIQASGEKSWALRFRSPVERDAEGNRKPKKLTLGPLANDGEGCDDDPQIGMLLTLADARALAIAELRKVRKGIDPSRERRAEKRAARARQSLMVEDVLAEFMAKHVRKKRKGTPIRESTRRKTGRLLGLEPKDGDLSTWVMCDPKSGVLAHWASRDIGSVTKRDVLDLLDSMVTRGALNSKRKRPAPVAANRTLSALKQAFSWCVKRDILQASPCDHIDAPSPEKSQERELSGPELVAIWRAAERVGYPYGPMVQLLILTGQRLDEVLAMVRSEINFTARMCVIPEDRTKNGREHHVPLSDQVMAILEGLPKIRSKASYLFTVSGDVPCSNLSRRKKRLDAIALAELRKIDPDISKLVPWRQHDVRHTLKTWMQRARIPKDVRNAVQNHYDRDMDELYGHYSFEKEKREALEKWAQHVAGIVAGTNIVELRRGQDNGGAKAQERR